ncbi:MAG: right-handed parallel beta-helix repeat-containing protein [Opitutales bacterium]
MKCLWVFFLLGTLLLPLFSGEASTWYVSPDGNDHTNGSNGLSPESPLKSIGWAFNNAASPGDTILVMDGVYRNGGYGSGSLTNGPAVHLNNSGTEGAPITLTNHPGHAPVIEFDGAGGFLANQIEHVDISGFTIRGPGQAISEAEALDHRLDNPKPNYYNGRGIAIWGPAHHITIRGNVVHDCPASGIRINKGDYLTISGNEVYANTRYTSSAESAIVVAEAQSIDEVDEIKIRIEQNRVWANWNLVPFFTPNPPDVGIEDYGTAEQDYIIDGSGVYMTRNKDYTHGWFYLANNISFNNGINGLVVHRTDRAIVANNTAYMNGATPLSSGRQSSSGITLNHADHVKVFNNISWARFEEDFALGAFGDFVDTTLEGNLVFVGTAEFESGFQRGDPRFLYPSVDPELADFTLRPDSPAVGAGVSNEYTPTVDFYGNLRDDSSMDIGAVADSGLEEPIVSSPPAASELVEGQSLDLSALLGQTASNADGDPIPGTFVFVDPTRSPAVGTTSQDVFFIPDDEDLYRKTVLSVSVTARSGTETTSARKVPIRFYGDEGLTPADEAVQSFEELDELDSDKDGSANWQEYLAGTDPKDRASRFEIIETNINAGQTIALKWLGGTRGPDRPYTIESTTNPSLGQSGWSEIDTAERVDGVHEWSTDLGTEMSRFFRVRAE